MPRRRARGDGRCQGSGHSPRSRHPRRATLEKFGRALGLRVADFSHEAGVSDPLAVEGTDTFGTWLRRMIATRGYVTEAAFARAIGGDPHTLNALINTVVTHPTYRTLWGIADALNVPVGEVIARARQSAEYGADDDRQGAGRSAPCSPSSAPSRTTGRSWPSSTRSASWTNRSPATSSTW